MVLSWKTGTISPARWIFNELAYVSFHSFRSYDAWFANEMHAAISAMTQFRLVVRLVQLSINLVIIIID